MYLHKDREMFKDMVEQSAEQTGRKPRAIGTITLISFHILLYLNWKMKDCRSI